MASPKPLPDLSLLRERFEYKDGALYYKVDRGRSRAGDPAGTPTDKGYLRTYVQGKTYPNHRLIYYIVTGENPGEKVVDHIDRDRGNNSIENLRVLSHTGNQLNRESCGFSKYGNRYRSRIRYKDAWIHLGYFDSAEEAHSCYLEFKKGLIYADTNL